MAEFNIEEYENLNPNVIVEGVKYLVPNRQCLWRVKSLHTKEPDTLEWISKFNNDDILIDIGANVGMYTIWAAVKQGVNVYAFEPESQNYALLCRNIQLNNIQDRVTAYCMAISDDKGEIGGIYIDRLNLSSFMLGSSCHSFGEEVDFHLKSRPSVFRQGCFSISLDHFIAHGELRDSDAQIHIKIDVDGIEHKVIASAMNTFKSSQVQSVLIELNTNLDQHNELIALMEGLGYKTTIHPDAIRTEGDFEGIGNHIFIRSEK